MKTFMIAATTLDGFIAKNHVHPTAWTSIEDKEHFRRLTKEAGVAVMGANTYKTLNHKFPERRTIVLTNEPSEITDPEVEATSEKPDELIKRLELEGHTMVAIIGGAYVFTQFLKAGLINEAYITIEPHLWGQGISLLSEDVDIKIELLEKTMLNENSILLHFKIVQ